MWSYSFGEGIVGADSFFFLLFLFQTFLFFVARAHSFAQLFMVVGALAGGVLAFYDFAIWVGMLSSFTSAVVAWTEFSGTEKKLDRYSNIVISLKSINLWWDSLPEVERLATKNISLLVETVEKEMLKERSG
jgi:hypothetical protein